MNKIPLFTLIFIIITISFLTFPQTTISKVQSNSSFLNISSFTKAVCEYNYCQDYLFKCNNTKITSISPVTGAAIQFNNKWKDPRNKNQIAKTC